MNEEEEEKKINKYNLKDKTTADAYLSSTRKMPSRFHKHTRLISKC